MKDLQGDDGSDEKSNRILQAEKMLFQFFQLLPPVSIDLDDDEKELFPQKPCQTPPSSARNINRSFQSRNHKHEGERSGSPTPTTPNSKATKSDSNSDDFYRMPPPPSTWAQRPLFIRATPGTSTQITGIRYGDNNKGNAIMDDNKNEATAVPINTGKEGPGQSIVVDFCSEHFVGTLLIRIRGAPPFHSNIINRDGNDYFEKRKRTFQGVVKGRFLPQPSFPKSGPRILDCVTGQTFRRTAGTLPARWIIQAFETLVQRLAPNNELHLLVDDEAGKDDDGGENDPKQQHRPPRSLAPLVTTAQTIQVGKVSAATPRIATNDQSSDNHDLILHDGHFFYDSVHDHHNLYYSANTIAHMEQEDWYEPHANDPSSLVYQVVAHDDHAFIDDDKKTSAAVAIQNNDCSQTNRKHRKAFFNKLLTFWKQEEEEAEQQKQQQMPDRPYTSKMFGNAPRFCTDRDYTFEFYEHLVVFDDPSGNMVLDLRLPFLRHIAVAPCTNGQPIQFMSAVRRRREVNRINHGIDDDLDFLWSFEIWHESLYNAIPSHLS